MAPLGKKVPDPCHIRSLPLLYTVAGAQPGFFQEGAEVMEAKAMKRKNFL